MGVHVIRKRVKAALSRSNLPGVDFTINPYVGCAHGCIYCYARLYCQKDIGKRWGEIVVIKENLPEVLGRELRRRVNGRVVLSTLTDAYQPLERREGLTRRILEILIENDFRVGIQTKSDLVLRDLDLFLQNVSKVDVGFTITTLDSSLVKIIEPHAPSPLRRVKAIERLSEEGIKTWIFLGPIIPESGDLKEVVEVAAATGSRLYYDRFRVKGFMKGGVVGEIADRARKTDWKKVLRDVEEACRAKGVEAQPAFR